MQFAAFDHKAFRNALGSFVTGITIVTWSGSDGERFGFTANSFSSVSLDPPLILFSLDKESSTFDSLSKAEAYAVNVLAEDQEDISNRFASKDSDKWKGSAWHEGVGGAPVLDSVLAVYECVPFAQYAGGDHDIFVGEVKRFEAGSNNDPLLFFRGGYARLEGEEK